MKRFLGPLISIITLLIVLTGAELYLRFWAPISDPYALSKNRITMTQYINSEFPSSLWIETKTESGLPGVQGKNLFTTNNLGFRGDSLCIPKPANEFRIFVVGGSTTECLYLDDSQVFTRILQNELNTHLTKKMIIKVYNAGKSGDASDDHISMIVHRIVHMQPDMIIVFCGINDLTRAIYNYDYRHYIKSLHEKPSLLLWLRMGATEFQIPRRIHYFLRRILPKTSKQILEEITTESNYQKKVELRMATPVFNKRPRTDLVAYRINLLTIIGVTKAHGIKLVFMTQPTTWNSSIDPKVKAWHWMLYRNGVTYREDLMDEAIEAINNVMREIASAQRIPFYDASKLLPKSLEFFYDDVHFNVLGARMVGKYLAAFMLKNALIPTALDQEN